jgi:hypothetical protein
MQTENVNKFCSLLGIPENEAILVGMVPGSDAKKRYEPYLTLPNSCLTLALATCHLPPPTPDAPVGAQPWCHACVMYVSNASKQPPAVTPVCSRTIHCIAHKMNQPKLSPNDQAKVRLHDFLLAQIHKRVPFTDSPWKILPTRECHA